MPSRCSSVDLPAPEGPMMEMNSPSFTSALMRRSTKVLVGPCSKYFSTLRRTIIGELIGVLYCARDSECATSGAEPDQLLVRVRTSLQAAGSAQHHMRVCRAMGFI